MTEGSHLFIVEAKNAHPPEPPLKVASDTPARDRLALFGGAYHRGPAGEDDVSKYLLKLTGSRETGSTIGEEEVDETELRETVVERFVESEKTRSCKLVEAARGYVDLRAIVEVRRTSANGSPRAERANDASLGADEDESDDEELASEPDAASRDVRSFEVELENGRIAHFEVRWYPWPRHVE